MCAARRPRLALASGFTTFLVTVLVTASAAWAAPATDFEMPFPCAQQWTGTSRSSHSPSPLAIDWNRDGDLGDPAVASAAGRVRTADRVDDSGYGRYVVIDHPSGESSLYAHLQTVYVNVGQWIDQGQPIGLVGESGSATGPHLHFEERSGSTVLTPYFHQQKFVFGSTLASRNCVDVPLAADFNNNMVAELAVFRRLERARFLIYRPGQDPIVRYFGTATDEPVTGDWDGNGTANLGIRTPATSTFTLRTSDGTRTVQLGAPADRPVAGDWNGDQVWDVGVRRAGTDTFLLRRADGSTYTVALGDADDLGVTGDWNGDGRTDLGAYDVSTARWSLRYVDREGTVWTATVGFGAAGDLPVTGDWDGNGTTDLGAWSPSTGTFKQRKATAPTSRTRSVASVRFGSRR